MRPLVVANQSAFTVDNGMWEGLVRAALRGGDRVRVECEGHDCLAEHQACRVRVRASGLARELDELAP